jgi:hypothetical protein
VTLFARHTGLQPWLEHAVALRDKHQPSLKDTAVRPTLSAALTAREWEIAVLMEAGKVTDADMADLRIERHAICPRWNYTIRPRTPVPTPP